MPIRPEHDTIQVVMNRDFAESIERMFPNAEIRLMPLELQREDALPTYVVTPTEEAMKRARGPHA